MTLLKSALLATALLAGYAGGEAQAADTITVPLTHNGSQMEGRLTGKRLSIVYAAPKASLATAGVKPGDELATLFYKGPGQWAGEARVFKKDCRPAIYSMTGTTTGEALVLTAEVGPVWVPGTVEWDRCQWKTSPESKHLRLGFDAASATELARLDPTTEEATKAARVGTIEEAWDKQAAERKARADEWRRPEGVDARIVRQDEERARKRLEDEVAELRAAIAKRDAEAAAQAATPAPVAETVTRNETRPPVQASEQVEPTEDQAAEAQAERALYSDPEFLKSIGAVGPLVSPQELAEDAKAAETATPEPAAPVQAEVTPEPAKPSLNIDF